MKLKSKINTTNMVSLVEKILPTTQKREWFILADKLTGSDDLFPKLIEFLLKEKRVIEYMDSNVHTSGGLDKVTVHNVSTHLTLLPLVIHQRSLVF